MGATKMTIFSQFLIESFIVNFSALIIAVVTVQLLSSLDINISGIMVSLPSNSILFVYVIYFTIVIFGTLIVGLYPAAIASSFKPSLSTKINEMALPLGLPNLRKVLVVSQFTLSMVLLIVAFSIFKQVSFMQKKDLGIDLDQTLVINTTASFGRSGADSTINRQFDVLRNQLSNYANVKGVALSYDIPGKKYKTLITSFRNGQNKEESLSMYFSRIDHSFIEIMDVKLLAGRNFSELENSNGGNVIINVEAVNDFRFDSPEDALGKKISYGNNYDVEGYEIIGVVDFRVTSFTEKNPPIVFQTFWGPKKYLSLKLDYENIEQLTGYIQQIKNEWTAIFPNKPFDYFYLKDSFETQYKDNVQFSEVLNKLTFLSILVACLGLYGLSIFLVQKKTKEIGIRKVFGSSSLALITLLLKDIMVLVFIAGFIAIPMGWILVNKWMQQYPYVNDLPWWTFVVPIVGIILITFLIIGNNVIRASYANPVASLRNE
jgi:putative ABC transport system permease protein